MSIDSLTTFLGWCSVINIAILLFSTLMMIIMRDIAVKIHSGLFVSRRPGSTPHDLSSVPG